MPFDAVYGAPPATLCPVPEGAQQFSPLLPNARALETLTETVSSVSMLAPPGTIERRYALAVFLRRMTADATMTALAPKDKGGARLARELASFGCEVDEDARQHHRICKVRKPAAPEGIEAAISEGAPRFDDALGLWTQPGVFSWNRLDPGSALLLEHLPPLAGKGADLGCGLGVLARRLLAGGSVKELHLLDIDGRAVSCARRNVEDPRAVFHWGDLRATRALPAGLDFVVANPPFHDGGHEDQSLGQAFVAQAAYLLRAGGVFWAVANRHLPYEETLREVFHRVSVRAENGAFKIFEAQR